MRKKSFKVVALLACAGTVFQLGGCLGGVLGSIIPSALTYTALEFGLDGGLEILNSGGGDTGA